MSSYILRRLMLLPVIIFLVSVILFFLIMQLPIEQRVQIYMPSARPSIFFDPDKYEAFVQRVIEKNGLDEPFPVQYMSWTKNLLKGQWGHSPTWDQPVLEGLLERASATGELILVAMIPSLALALLLGKLSVRYHRRMLDKTIRIAAFIGWAFPSFILGLILLNIFYGAWGWFPPSRLSTWATTAISTGNFHVYTGMNIIDSLLNGEIGIFLDSLRHLVLPAFVLALAQWALLTRIMRSSMLEELEQDYIFTARGKGVKETHVVGVHAGRNAILPVISATGVALSTLLTTVVVIETVFNFNGVARWAAAAITHSDIPVAVGFSLFACIVSVFASLIADILYAVFDPRVRL